MFGSSVTSLHVRYPTRKDAPILSHMVNGKLQVLRYSVAMAFLKKWSKDAGIVGDVGFHSFRCGAVTEMHVCGFGLQDIRDKGDMGHSH